MSFRPTAPNRIDVVRQMSEEHPTEWRNAHREDVARSDAEAFIKRLASRLHADDTRFGLNGKRGTTALSQDAVSFKNASGPGGVEIIDVIASAGSPQARPAWNDVTQATIDAGTVGRFIAPPAVEPERPTPTRPVTGGFQPTAPDRLAVVAQAAREHAAAFGDAGRDDVSRERAVAFVTIVAGRLHALDERFGLNGKRGTSEPSLDAVAFKNAGGPGGVEIVRVVSGAGTSDPEAVWRDVTQATIDAGTVGRFIEPPEPPAPPVDGTPGLAALEARVEALEAQVRALAQRVRQLEE